MFSRSHLSFLPFRGELNRRRGMGRGQCWSHLYFKSIYSSTALIPLEPAKKLRGPVLGGSLVLKADSVFIFTCGAASSEETGMVSAREKVMGYAQKHIKDFQFFEAESIFQKLGDKRKKDLLSLEKELADFSDCILIFLESPGAQSELGAFAMYDDLAEITLAVNKEEYESERSFITDGPIEKVNKTSKFGEAIYTEFDSILTSMYDIEKRLSSIKRKRGKSIEGKKFEELKKENPKVKMLLISDIVSLYSPIYYSELVKVLSSIFKSDSNFDVKTDIAFLEAVGFAKRVGDNLIVSTTKSNRKFFKYPDNYKWKRERSTVIRNYFMRDRKRFKLLSERI